MAFFDKDPNYHALHEHCLFEVRDGNKSSKSNNVNVIEHLDSPRVLNLHTGYSRFVYVYAQHMLRD